MGEPKQGCNVYFRVMLAVQCSLCRCELSIGSLTSCFLAAADRNSLLILSLFQMLDQIPRREGGPVHPTGPRGAGLVRWRRNSLGGQRGDWTPSAECAAMTFYHLSRLSLWDKVAVHFRWRNSHLIGLIPPATDTYISLPARYQALRSQQNKFMPASGTCISVHLVVFAR